MTCPWPDDFAEILNWQWEVKVIPYWRDFVSELQLAGYGRVMSIEHEDSLMSIDEGLRKAVAFLKNSIITEPKPSGMSWA